MRCGIIVEPVRILLLAFTSNVLGVSAVLYCIISINQLCRREVYYFVFAVECTNLSELRRAYTSQVSSDVPLICDR